MPNSGATYSIGIMACSLKIRNFGAREYHLDSIPGITLTNVQLPPEPICQSPNEDAIEQAERERQIRKSQLKLQWDLTYQQITQEESSVEIVHEPQVVKMCHSS